MTRITTALLILSLSVASTNAQSTCNYVTLVKCFINILDECTWTLYELKENVVTINADQCQHLAQLQKCIDDDLPETHECSHSEVVSASNTVSDLLTHRKNSGSFLKSYYLLTYACSPEGQELLTEHRSCLSRERIGEMTLSAGTYLSEKFLEHPDDQVCFEVNNKLQEYMDAMSGLCEEEASQIMCKSLVNMFKGLHTDKLSACEFDCLRQTTTALPIEDQEIGEMQAESGQLNSSSLRSHTVLMALFSLVVMTGMAYLLQ